MANLTKIDIFSQLDHKSSCRLQKRTLTKALLTLSSDGDVIGVQTRFRPQTSPYTLYVDENLPVICHWTYIVVHKWVCLYATCRMQK